jgi:hypothetical protein
MGYLAEGTRREIEEEYRANLEAVRHARMSDWAAYQKIVGWLDGVEAVLAALERAERAAGYDDRNGFVA